MVPAFRRCRKSWSIASFGDGPLPEFTRIIASCGPLFGAAGSISVPSVMVPFAYQFAFGCFLCHGKPGLGGNVARGRLVLVLLGLCGACYVDGGAVGTSHGRGMGFEGTGLRGHYAVSPQENISKVLSILGSRRPFSDLVCTDFLTKSDRLHPFVDMGIK